MTLKFELIDFAKAKARILRERAIKRSKNIVAFPKKPKK